MRVIVMVIVNAILMGGTWRCFEFLLFWRIGIANKCHCFQALIATAFAASITGDAKYKQWHMQVGIASIEPAPAPSPAPAAKAAFLHFHLVSSWQITRLRTSSTHRQEAGVSMMIPACFSLSTSAIWPLAPQGEWLGYLHRDGSPSSTLKVRLKS
jgi:hypothetical protein